MRIPPAIAKRERLLRRIVIGLGFIVLLGCATRAVHKPFDGDFKVHRETGRRFLAGEFLYANGHDFPYPPLLGMVFAPTAMVPVPVAKAVFYPVAVIALLLLLWTMTRLVRSSFKLNETQTFWTTALAVFMGILFIMRDQAELGLNTAITALVWLAVALWQQNRDVLAGTSLGAAIAIKCTPAIFLGYFLWKRQWRMGVCTAVATLLFTVAPILGQGPASWSNHMKIWIDNATQGITGGGSGAEKMERFRTANMSLRPVLTRYLTPIPNDPSSPHADPPALEFLNLPPGLAAVIVNAILIVLGLTFLWWSRGQIVTRGDPRVLWELAAAGALLVLVSPITWMQHCVALIPACYLVAALVVVRDRLPGWILTLLGAYILFCSVLGRDLLPREVGLVLISLHITTLAMAGLFAVLLAGPRLQHER